MLVASLVLALAPVKLFWTIDMNGRTRGEAAMVNSIQGIANRRGPLVWQSGGGMTKLFIEQMKAEGWTERKAKSPWDLVDVFKQDIKGAVEVLDDVSNLNEAATTAGLADAVVVPVSYIGEAKKRGLMTIVKVSTKPSMEIAVEQPNDKAGFLRDYAIKHRAKCFWSKDSADRAKNLQGLSSIPLIFGWGPDEYEWICDISKVGGSGVAADWCSNLSAMESLGGKIQKLPKTKKEAEPKKGERIVAFVLSDGDNIQWLTGGMPLEETFYANKNRGSFKMTWEVCPMLATLAPRVLDYFYSNATPMDGFIAAGVPAYSYPHLLQDRKAQAKQAQPYIKKSNLRVVGLLNTNDGDLNEVKDILNLPEVDAVLYKDYAPYHRRNGAVWWHKGKPCISYRYSLWEGMAGASPQELADKIAKLPADPQNNIDSYTLITVHAWSYGKIGGPINAVKQTVDLLPKGTRVVTAPELVGWMRKYLAPKS